MFDSDSLPTPELVYARCLNVLEDIKVTSGPLAVSSTLKKRPDLAKFILGCQVDELDGLCELIKALTVRDASVKLDSESK